MKKSLLFAAVLGCVICSCEKPEPDVDGGGSTAVDKVALSPKSYTFKAEESTLAVVVESSAEWTLTPAEYEWIKPDVTKGKNGDKITFTASANTEKTKRGPVTFTLTVGKATATFRAEQEAAKEEEPDPTPGVEFELQDPAQKDLSYEVGGGSAMVSIKTALKAADITVTLSEGASWVTTQKADNPQTNLPVVGIVVPKNEGAARTATVTLSAEGANDIVINVSQAGTAPQPVEKSYAVNFNVARLYSNWPNPAPLTDLSKFTLEALVNAETFYKGSNPDENINTILGIEGTFHVRVWGTSSSEPGDVEVMFNNKVDGKDVESGLRYVAYIDANKWYHIAATFDNGNIALYVNGEKKGEKALDNGVTSLTIPTGEWAQETNWGSTRHFYLGFSCDQRRCLKGNMSEVRIWNKVLSESEINAAGHFYSVDASSDGLVAYWKLNDGEGSVAKDYTANGNDLYGHTGFLGNGGGGSSVGEAGIQWVEVEDISVN